VKKVTPKKQGSSSSDQVQSDLPRLAAPAQRALVGAGVQKLADLTKFSEEEVKQWHGIGPNALKQLRQALNAHGLSFVGEKNKKP
jgi:hypothetical protein